MSTLIPCRMRQEWEALLERPLSSADAEPLAQHLEACDTCADLVDAAFAGSPLVAVLQAQSDAEKLKAPPLLVQRLIGQYRDLHSIPGVDATAALLLDEAAPFVPALPLDATQSLPIFSPPRGPSELGWLAHYRVVKQIGEGGMGLVFLADDSQLQRQVALKVMRPEMAARAAHRERFVREARAAAAIEHDHIVPIYQVGEEKGVPFLAMKLLKGESLESYLNRGALMTPLLAARLGQEIALGLTAAHECGLIHRDVKPANVWLEKVPVGRVKLLDFGLARGRDGAHLTLAGAIVGTPSYMAPEQARGADVDSRADLFSLGVLLYRLLTGRLPFLGKDAVSTLLAVTTETPAPVRLLNPSVPPALAGLVMQLLEKDPAQRPASAAEVARVLAAVVNDEAVIPAAQTATGTKGLPVPPRKKRWLLWIGLGAAAAMILLAGGIIIRIKTPDGKEKTIEVQEGSTITIEPGDKPNGQPIVDAGKPPSLAVAPFDVATAKEHQKAWAKHLGVDVEITNSIGMKLRLIPPGEFMMGLAEADVPPELEKSTDRWLKEGFLRVVPPKKVTLPAGYFCGTTEVTVSQFRQFVDATKHVTEGERDGKGGRTWVKGIERDDPKAIWKNPGYPLQEDLPVTHVSVEDAMAFCNWLSAVEKLPPAYQHDPRSGWTLIPGSTGYRLPTESEWEFACRAGTTTAYSLGAGISISEHAWVEIDGGPRTVGLKAPNAYGLFDMHGNVGEFCYPEWSLPEKGEPDGFYAYRGGSWNYGHWIAKSGFSGRTAIHSRDWRSGFRVVRGVNLKTQTPLPAEKLGKPIDEAWIKEVAALLPEKQVEAVAAKLKELNPEFSGKIGNLAAGEIEFTVKDGIVHEVKVPTDHIADISPVRALLGLQHLHCTPAEGWPKGKGELTDLRPLRGLPLRSLNVSCNRSLSDITPLQDIKLDGLDLGATKVQDLEALRGMPLQHLAIHFCPIRNLSPLAGKKLLTLYLPETNVTDLSPLKGMALTNLDVFCDGCQDLALLQEMPLVNLNFRYNPWRDADLIRKPTLKTINYKPADEFRKEAAAQLAPFEEWCQEVAALPVEKQADAVGAKLKELNPDFDGKVTAKVEDDKVIGLTIPTDNVTDISPVRALPGLKTLYCQPADEWKGSGKLVDLRPLRGLPLEIVRMDGNRALSDLTPLAGMKLTALRIYATKVADLEVVREMPLEEIGCQNTRIKDLSPLAGKRMRIVYVNGTQVSDLSPLKGMEIIDLGISHTPAFDLSILADMPLKVLQFDYGPWRDADLIRKPSLQTINYKQADEFRKEVAAQMAVFESWCKDVAAMEPQKQVEAVSAKLKELNPDFSGKVGKFKNGEITFSFEDGKVTSIQVPTDHVTDISPLRALSSLKIVWCLPVDEWHGSGRLVDLRPLKGLPLEVLGCCGNPALTDLTPVAGMKLRELWIHRTGVVNLAVVKNLPLELLNCQETPLRDLSPVAGMRLTAFSCAHTKVGNLSPLKGMKLTLLEINGAPVEDLSLLADMPLENLKFDYRPARDAELVRKPTLKTINGKPAEIFRKEVANK